MQALHFTYGLGSFVAPLICEPFLSTESVHHGSHGPPVSGSLEPSFPVSSTPSSVVATTLLGEAAVAANSSQLLQVNDTNLENILNSIDPIDFLIYVPYAIAGAITVFSALIILVLYYYKKYEPPVKVKST